MCVAVGAVGLQGIALRGFTPVCAESEGWEESEAGGVCIGVVFQVSGTTASVPTSGEHVDCTIV